MHNHLHGVDSPKSVTVGRRGTLAPAYLRVVELAAGGSETDDC
jgi:hypothetical protein